MSISYTAPPTVSQFMQSEAFVRILMGPVGSGKTTAVLFEALRRAIQQKPGPDGIRRTRWAIVRTTLSQMKMTILLDMLTWFRQIASYKVSDQLVTLRFNDVLAEFYLIPLEEEEDQKRLLSMQLTGCIVNEATEINPDLISAIAGRVGRFPSKVDGGPSWFGIIGDTNTPIIGSDWWKLFEEDKPADWQLFHQPSGLSPDAENVENLAPGYYERLAKNPSRAWVQRYVLSEYGEDPSGTAVFRDSFKRSFHVKRNLEVVKGQMLLVGIDCSGRNPCAVITQPDFHGRLNILEEVIATDIGLETHVNAVLKGRIFQERYAGLMFAAVGDPSGMNKGNVLEENNFDVLNRLGIPAFPAPTNSLDPRIGAVETLLLQQRDGGPAIVFDEEKCPFLIRAMNGGYMFGKSKDGVTKPVPNKNHPASDLADALQYVCLVINSGMVHFIARKIRPKLPNIHKKARVSAAGWT